MPGPLLHVGASVMCPHGGQAQPAEPNRRVWVAGQPTVTMSMVFTVTGCGLVGPAQEGGGPCVIATWVTGATRVTAGGVPLLLADSVAVCSPTGTPLTTARTQTRVTGV